MQSNQNMTHQLWTPDPYNEGQLGQDYTILNYGTALDPQVPLTYVANATNGYTYSFKLIPSSATSVLSIRRAGYIDSTSVFIKGAAPAVTINLYQGFRREAILNNFLAAGSYSYAISTSSAAIDNSLVDIALTYSSSAIYIVIDTTDLALHIDDPTLTDAQVQENLAKIHYYLGLHTVISY